MLTQRTTGKIAQKQNAVPFGWLPVDDDLSGLLLQVLNLPINGGTEPREENY